MVITVEAVYENGVLKLAQPLPLAPQEKVEVTVRRKTSRADQTYGLLGWTGDPKVVEYFAKAPELDPQEGP